ncbi:unnamed protein product [Diamesa hyperborea]
MKDKSKGQPDIELLYTASTGEQIQDIAYDFVDESLYWTEKKSRSIKKLQFSADSKETTFYQSETDEFHALAIDLCNRTLYFTNSNPTNPSVNMISINSTSNHKAVSMMLGNATNHYQPFAITIDHTSDRIYLADKREGSMYSIDSMNRNGQDFRSEFSNRDRTPISVAVNGEFVYYVDSSNNNIRRLAKGQSYQNRDSNFVLSYHDTPVDLIIQKNMLGDSTLPQCKKIQSKLQSMKEAKSKTTIEAVEKHCLNDGKFIKSTGKCMCKKEFEGDFCERDLCYNYCLNDGECYIRNNKPVCSCSGKFNGVHCEHSVCPENYCLNGGVCRPDAYNNPKCSCDDNEKFIGARCELEVKNVCFQYCLAGKTKKIDGLLEKLCNQKCPSFVVPTSPTGPEPPTEDIETPKMSSENLTQNSTSAFESCSHKYTANVTYIVLAVCFTSSLLLFLVIMVLIHKFNNPARPKIRKKYVVHKNMEPLTCRPSTTEQCEVIIEDCCNMNICDTPCFDPKVLQQEINNANINVTLTSSRKCREDKDELLKNMELDY